MNAPLVRTEQSVAVDPHIGSHRAPIAAADFDEEAAVDAGAFSGIAIRTSARSRTSAFANSICNSASSEDAAESEAEDGILRALFFNGSSTYMFQRGELLSDPFHI